KRCTSRSRDRSASCRCSRRRPIGRRCSPRRSSGSPTRSTESRAATSRRRPTTCFAARRAASHRCAGGTTLNRDPDCGLRIADCGFIADSENPQSICNPQSVRNPHSAIDNQSALCTPHSAIPAPDLPDAGARDDAVDPARNVVLEASAGTGKTRVLVERYVNLLRAGVEPDHILAITFTRKAAAEMRQRIVDRLKEASRTSELDAARWRELRERLGDIAISTIDAFCLSLLREFPLEADVDPGFDLAADTDVPRLIGEALDQALRICRAVARDDDDVALVFAQLGERRLRAGIAALLDRRLVAPLALRRFLPTGPRALTAAAACPAPAARPAA